MLGQVTAKPEQLSAESTDKALAFVASFNVTALDGSAVADVAEVASNLLTASTNQFAAWNVTSAAAEEQARQRSSMLTNVVDSLASSLAAGLVAGEAEVSLATKTFAMAVTVDAPSNLEAPSACRSERLGAAPAQWRRRSSRGRTPARCST